MKILGYSFLVLILPIIILIILLTIMMLPKMKAKRKEIRKKIMLKGRPLSKEEKSDLKTKAIREFEAEMGTEDLTTANKELMSELKNRDLKELFKTEGKKDNV